MPEKLAEPLKWATPKTIFVNSMSDLFHEEISDSYVEQVINVMQLAHWHTFQVLTKRAERMGKLLATRLAFASRLPHIWWGTSVENRKHGVPRIDHLRCAPAAMRFLSIEPLLEDLGELDLSGIGWVIVGGESGARPRQMDKEWVNRIKEQCEKAAVPFFFKQWGGVRKSESGRLLDGRTYDEMPERPRFPSADKRIRLEMVEQVNIRNLQVP